MVSETLRRRASRRNGAKGKGPKTASGKSRARRNALRHGLEAIRFDDESICAEVQRIVRMLCPGAADVLRLDLAVAIAESQVVLSRVRTARTVAFARVREQIAGGDCLLAINALRRLDRYERRALSRRRHAIESLERHLLKRNDCSAQDIQS